MDGNSLCDRDDGIFNGVRFRRQYGCDGCSETGRCGCIG